MGFTKENIDELSTALKEPGWVLDRRLEAWDWFSKLELPHEKDEPWRYTNLMQLRFNLDAFSPSLPKIGVSEPEQGGTMQAQLGGGMKPQDGAGQPEQSGPADPERAGLVVQHGCDVGLAELAPELAEQGVIFTDLHTAIVEHEELVRGRLFTGINHEGHIFNALHAALFSGGTFLYVPRGVTVAACFESQRWIDDPGSAAFPHSLIIAEEGAEVVHLETFKSPKLAGAGLSSGATEIFAAASARVASAVLQDHSKEVWHFQSQRAVVERDVQFSSILLTLGGRFSRQEVGTVIKGPGAGVNMAGLYFASAGQHFDFRTLQDHASDHGTSDLLYKGALRDDAHTVYSGLIHVRPNGAETDAYQTNRNLVLSDHAKADSKPELEIENNDVRCSHAASVGQLNEDEIFYLVSRGIPRERAERLIVNGFFEEAIARATNPVIRRVLSAALESKIEPAG